MGMKLRLPNINGVTDKEQLLQIKSYLYQMAEELQWALGSIESGAGTGSGPVEASSAQSIGATAGNGGNSSSQSPGETFNAIKGLVIKSADIVNAYYEEINGRLESIYVAESDFGTYKEENELKYSATASDIEVLFSNDQTLESNLLIANGDINSAQESIGGLTEKTSQMQTDILSAEDKIDNLGDSINAVNEDVVTVHGRVDEANGRIDSVGDRVTKNESEIKNLNGLISSDGKNTVILSTDAWIRLGAIATKESGHYLYGLEIGQTDEVNGQVVDKKFAQYTSEGTYLYDENETLVAQIARGKLVIEEAVFNVSYKLGGFRSYVDADNGVVEKWEG